MKYVCEICNKQFNTVDEAERCEVAHKKERAQVAAKASAETKINEAVNAFVARYKVIPRVELTTENQNLFIGELDGVLDFLMELLGIGECEDEECDGCGHCDICSGCPNGKSAK